MEMQKQQADGRIFEAKPTERRYDFVLFFEVREANPNGDPDAGNLPRTDPLTQEGLVTDVSIKRKWRDYVFEAKKNAVRLGSRIWTTASRASLATIFSFVITEYWPTSSAKR